jgi:hypothetical protein
VYFWQQSNPIILSDRFNFIKKLINLGFKKKAGSAWLFGHIANRIQADIFNTVPRKKLKNLTIESARLFEWMSISIWLEGSPFPKVVHKVRFSLSGQPRKPKMGLAGAGIFFQDPASVDFHSANT